jgi:hypothetical protein
MKKTSKLHLSMETLRRLTATDLAGIAGGLMRSYNTHPCSNQSLIYACELPGTFEPDGSCDTYIDCDHQSAHPPCNTVPIN